MSQTIGTVGRLTDAGVRKHIAFRLAEQTVRPWVAAVTSENLDSNKLTEDYVMSGTAPPMQVWTDGNDFAEIGQYGFQVVNKKFNTGTTIPLDLIRRDQVGEALKAANQLPTRSVQQWEKLCIEQLVTGKTQTGYDKVAFFSTAHARREGANQSNLIDGSEYLAGFTPADAKEAGDLIQVGIDALTDICDDFGEPMNQDEGDFLVLVPSNLQRVFRQALGKEVITSGGAAIDNPLLGYGDFSVRLQSSVRLKNQGNDWDQKIMIFLPNSTMGNKALKRQQEWEKLVMWGDDSDFAKDHDKWKFAARASRAVGLENFETCVLVEWETS